MHLKEIIETALEWGAKLKGKRPVNEQVRNALKGSKRFVNLGSNTWWLAGIPEPSNGTTMEGSPRRFPVALLAEEDRQRAEMMSNGSNGARSGTN